MATKVREAIRIIEEDGGYRISQEGSHRQYRHPTKPGKVTIAGQMSETIPAGTWASIRRQAGLSGR